MFCLPDVPRLLNVTHTSTWESNQETAELLIQSLLKMEPL